MSFITSIATSHPDHRIEQSAIASFMVKAMQLDEVDQRALQVLFRATGINTRYSVLSDYSKTENFEFYSNQPGLEPFPSTRARMDVYRQHAVTLSAASARSCLASSQLTAADITHLIVVSCTGLYAPGLDIELVKELGLRTSVERTCINFMGCYAAFNAIKLADSFCQSNANARVLIVCTELCSIHFQKESTEDNWLANALFADGSAAVLMQTRPGNGVNLRPISFYCDIAPDTPNEMAWTVGDFGFEMKLSSYVPTAIRQGIRSLTHRLLSKVNRSSAEIDFYAIHPGGKRILEVIEQELNLTSDQNRFSYRVLRDFGNMSSPTVLFVLNDIRKQLTSNDKGKTILSFAFGPGLTLESMALTIEEHGA